MASGLYLRVDVAAAVRSCVGYHVLSEFFRTASSGPALQDFPPFIYRIYLIYFLPLDVLPLILQKRTTGTPRQDASDLLVPRSVLLVECGTTLRYCCMAGQACTARVFAHAKTSFDPCFKAGVLTLEKRTGHAWLSRASRWTQ